MNLDCEVVMARDLETGETHELLRIPEGYVACVMPKESAGRLSEWTECCAVRIATDGGALTVLEVTNDLDWVTSPEGEK